MASTPLTGSPDTGRPLGDASTLLADVDLDAPGGRVSLAGHRRLRALVWCGRIPVAEITASDVEAVDVTGEAHRRHGAEIAAARSRPAPTPSSDLPAVTVAICTHDRSRDLGRCLAALLHQDDPPAHDILVVDNAPSDDRSRDLVRRTPGVRYVREDLPGLDFARNRALATATGEVIAFLDDDTRPQPGWLRAVAAAFVGRPEVAACSGPVFPAELETEAQELLEQLGGFNQDLTPRLYGSEPPDAWHAPHWPAFAITVAAGANLALRARTAVALGGFDEALDAGRHLPGGGDQDMLYRLLRAGHTLAYEPAMLVRHRHRRELHELREQLVESWARGCFAFLVKSYRSDPDHRPQLLRAARWVLGNHLRRLVRRLWRSDADPLPARVILGELAGCWRGLWAYGASRRRARRLRARFEGR